MEKVLRDSNDGVLIYVAPTKALVSQIAAEVYARFSKKLAKGWFLMFLVWHRKKTYFFFVSGALWAIHTRDWRVHDPQNCQILVTVPEILAIMLLSPPLARTWVPRVKRLYYLR